MGWLAALLLAAHAQIPGLNPTTLLAVGAHGAPVTVFTATLGSSSTIGSSESQRVVIPAIATGGNQINASMQAGTGAGMTTTHCSVGISNGTASQTVATPVELTFSGGAHGFTISASGTITSDWVNFTTTNGQALVVICDLNIGSAYAYNVTGTSYFATQYDKLESGRPRWVLISRWRPYCQSSADKNVTIRTAMARGVRCSSQSQRQPSLSSIVQTVQSQARMFP